MNSNAVLNRTTPLLFYSFFVNSFIYSFTYKFVIFDKRNQYELFLLLLLLSSYSTICKLGIICYLTHQATSNKNEKLFSQFFFVFIIKKKRINFICLFIFFLSRVCLFDYYNKKNNYNK